jgi:hypothetical protein
MVVAELDIKSIAVPEPEANAPLVIYGDCMLPFPITRQLMKSVSWWNFEVVQTGSEIYILKLSNCPGKHIRRHHLGLAGFVKLLCTLIGECLDHGAL